MRTPVRRISGHIAFVEEDELASHRQQRGDVGSDEVFVVAHADHDRATGASEDHAVRRIFGNDGERIRAFQLGDRGAHRAENVAELLLVEVNAMRDHFGVGLGGELIAELGQLLTQLFVVLDDAVVNDGDAVPRDMRVRVALGRHAMGRPAGVGDAQVAVDRGLGQGVLQLTNFADSAQPAQVAGAIQNGRGRRSHSPDIPGAAGLRSGWERCCDPQSRRRCRTWGIRGPCGRRFMKRECSRPGFPGAAESLTGRNAAGKRP